MPASLGQESKTVFIHDVENHKLHLEFTVAAGQAVKKGQPLILNTDGTVQAAAANVDRTAVIGYAIHDAAAEELVTAGMRAYAVVIGSSAGALDAGAVKYAGYDGTNEYNQYVALGASEEGLATAWALEAAAGADVEVRYALMG